MIFCFKIMLSLIVAAKHQFKYCAGLEDNFAAIYLIPGYFIIIAYIPVGQDGEDGNS